MSSSSRSQSATSLPVLDHTYLPLELYEKVKRRLEAQPLDAKIHELETQAKIIIWNIDNGRYFDFQPFIKNISEIFFEDQLEVDKCELIDGLEKDGKRKRGITYRSLDHQGRMIIEIKLDSRPKIEKTSFKSCGQSILSTLLHELVHAGIGQLCCWGRCLDAEDNGCYEECASQAGASGHGKA